MAPKLQIIFEGVDNVSGAIKDVGKGFDGLEGAADKAHKKLSPLTDLIGGALKAGIAGLAAGTAALGGVIISSVGDAMKFEQGLADISANMGATTEQTAQLKGLIQDLGFDPQLKVNATEAAEAIGTLGTAGLSVDEIMGGAARSTVLLANATGADFATAASIATDVMAQFNIKAEDLTGAVNGITSATIASKFDINDYRLALAQAGAQASAVGVEFDDFNTTIALIAPNFASGSDAGTSLKTLFQRLIPATADARSKMAELGLSTSDWEKASSKMASVLGHEVLPNAKSVYEAFTEMHVRSGTAEAGTDALNKKFHEFMDGNQLNQFYDANGALKDMSEISVVLQNALGGLTEQQKNETLAVLFGTDASRAALGVMSGGVIVYQTAAEAATALGLSVDQMAKYAEGGITQFEVLEAQMAQTDAADQASKRMDTLSGAMEILWGVIDTLKLQIGDAFLPIVRTMIELFTAQAQKHGPALIAMFQGLAAQLQVALASFLPWVETNLPLMIEQIPDLVMSIGDFIGSLISFGKEMWIAIKPVIEFIREHVSLKTILLAVGAIMGISAIASMVSFVAGIVGAVGAVAGFVGSIGGLGAALSALLIPFAPVVAVIAVVAAAIAGLYVAWQHNLFGIREKTAEVFNWVKQLFTDFPGAIEVLKQKFFEWSAGAMTKLKEGFEFTKGVARAGLDVAMNWIAQGRDAALPPFQQAMFNGGRTALTKLGEGFTIAKEAAKAELGRVMTDVQNHGAGFAAGAFAGRMYESARAAILQFGKGFTESAPHLKQDITNALNLAGAAFAEMNLGGKAHEAWNQIAESFNAFMGQDGFLGHVASVMGDIGRNVIESLSNAIINSMEGLRDALNTISNLMPQWVKEKLGIASPSKVFAELGQNVMAGMAQGIQSMALAPMAALSESMAGMMAVPGQMGATAGASAGNNTTSFTQSRTNNFNLNLPGGGNSSSQPVEQVRSLIGQLSATYG